MMIKADWSFKAVSMFMAAELKNMMICLQQLRAIVYLLGVTGGGQVELLAALPPQLSLFSVSGGAQPSLFNKHRW